MQMGENHLRMPACHMCFGGKVNSSRNAELGVVRNFRSFFKSVFPKNLLGLPPPPPPHPPLTFVQKMFDGHPNVYVYQCVLEHPYKLYAGPLVDSNPLHHYHQPDNSSLRYVYRALSPQTPAMLFRN